MTPNGIYENQYSTMCNQVGCKTIPCFNFPNEKKGLYCAKHKKPGMVDVKNKTCLGYLCDTIVSNPQYQGYCLRCFIHLFPDKPVARNYKTKEYSVVEFIKNTFPEQSMSMVFDKTIDGGCSKKRPDILLDLGYQVIIVEIDENQHMDYECSCENKRLMELSRDVHHRPIICIRFNPDKYLLNGKTITSCWGTNKQGICVVKKTKTKEWEERLRSLSRQIDYWCQPTSKTDKTVEVIQLFYDT